MPDQPLPPASNLRILTLNVGLLRLRLFGVQVFSNPPYVLQRLEEIPKTIRELRPDVVCLQECYEQSHLEKIKESLSDMLPHAARDPSGGSGGLFSTRFHNGLVVLSKHAISGVRFEAYREASTLERLLANKGQLVVDLELPTERSRVMRVINLHTTAGGTVDPEHPGADAIRQSEIEQAFESAHQAHEKGHPCIIVGDLNAGPEASPDNYQSLLDRGFRDAWVSFQSTSGQSGHQSSACTWDPKNPLNAVGPHKHCPPQRCDHVFLPTVAGFPDGHMDDWGVVMAELCATESKIVVGKDKRVTVSDHYGLMFDIQRV